jgi:hypothetical protein
MLGYFATVCDMPGPRLSECGGCPDDVDSGETAPPGVDVCEGSEAVSMLFAKGRPLTFRCVLTEQS